MKLNHIIAAMLAIAIPAAASAKEDKEAKAPKEPLAINVVPCPQSVLQLSGTFNAAGASVTCDQAIDELGRKALEKFAVDLSMASGKTSSFATASGLANSAEKGNVKGFAFYKDVTLKPESYQLRIDGKGVKVAVSDSYGVLYAIQTIKQIMPANIYTRKPVDKQSWDIPCCAIKDTPRFGYRGVLLDCARHFFTVAEVKKFLDVMAIYKLNRLHWHLTEDQGWRIEIKKYPELTQVGAFRDGTQIGKDRSTNDGIRYGGYYTQEQIKDVIAYAAERGITIVPEVDLPGHMLSAIASYPYLGHGAGPFKVWSRWGISDQVLCPGKETTFEFLENVLAEVAELFPSEYIHIGGDECPKKEWQQCPDCQAKIAELGLKADDHATAEQRLQNYVTARIQAFLATKGKKIIGWDEILEGDLADGATVMSWRGTKGGIKAAEMGHDVVMSPNSYCYIDHYQMEDKESEPLAIGGYLPLSKCYSYNPTDEMTPAMAAHILGVQCNLWTEYIATDDYLEYMLLPRMLAVSEVQWCNPSVKNFDRFKSSVNAKQVKILDILGYNYCKKDLQ